MEEKREPSGRDEEKVKNKLVYICEWFSILFFPLLSCFLISLCFFPTHREVDERGTSFLILLSFEGGIVSTPGLICPLFQTSLWSFSTVI